MCRSREYEMNTLFIVCLLETSEEYLHLYLTTYTIILEFYETT